MDCSKFKVRKIIKLLRVKGKYEMVKSNNKKVARVKEFFTYKPFKTTVIKTIILTSADSFFYNLTIFFIIIMYHPLLFISGRMLC
jgi:uncharacterized protein YbcC (UPF0753/DUF2309 family)